MHCRSSLLPDDVLVMAKRVRDEAPRARQDLLVTPRIRDFTAVRQAVRNSASCPPGIAPLSSKDALPCSNAHKDRANCVWSPAEPPRCFAATCSAKAKFGRDRRMGAGDPRRFGGFSSDPCE